MARPHPPTTLSIFFIYLGNMYLKKTHKTTHIFREKKNPNWGIEEHGVWELMAEGWISVSDTVPTLETLEERAARGLTRDYALVLV